MMKQLFCLYIILLPLLVVVSEATFVGGWMPIKNLSDPTVVEMAKFAIAEHNKQSKADLVYEKVLAGKTQVVAGILYKLVIAAKNGTSKSYQAVVWSQPWRHYKNLQSFTAL